MGGGTVPFGGSRGVDAGVNADMVKNIIVNRHQRQGTILLIFFAGMPPKGSNNVRLVRDSQLRAVNGAKPETMPSFEFRMACIIRVHGLPVKFDKGGVR